VSEDVVGHDQAQLEPCGGWEMRAGHRTLWAAQHLEIMLECSTVVEAPLLTDGNGTVVCGKGPCLEIRVVLQRGSHSWVLLAQPMIFVLRIKSWDSVARGAQSASRVQVLLFFQGGLVNASAVVVDSHS